MVSVPAHRAEWALQAVVEVDVLAKQEVSEGFSVEKGKGKGQAYPENKA